MTSVCRPGYLALNQRLRNLRSSFPNGMDVIAVTGKGLAARFSGRTLEEALSRAARELQVSSAEELGYRIVEQRSAGLLSRPIVTIEAWVETCSTSEDDHVDEPKVDLAIDGMSIRVKPPPEGEDTEPVAIWAMLPVRLRVNGTELRDGEVAEVTPNDVISADIGANQVPFSQVQVNISKDGLTASISIESRPAPRFELAIERARKGYRVVAREAGVNEPAPISVDEVVQALRDKGVIYSIDEEAIRKALADEVRGEVVVAQGKPPVPTVQDVVDYAFENGVRRSDTEGVVDYHEFWVTPCVAPGDVLAEKTVGRQGEPGIKVTGEEIPVEPYRPVVLQAAEGAEVSADGTKITATRPGRPVLVNNRVGVNRMYELSKGVGLHTSNIHFDGEVLVRGDVSENMLVEATGNIDVTGCGYECTLVSKKHVQVAKSLVGSHVVAGGAGASLGRIRHGLRNIVSQLESVADSVRYLDESPKEDSSRKEIVMRDLLESSYRPLSLTVNELLEHMAHPRTDSDHASRYNLKYVEFGIPEDICSVIRLLSATANRLDLVTWPHLCSVLETTRQAVERIETMLTGDCVAKIGYCQSSVIEADGDIHILKQGSVNSSLRSGGNVTVAGVVRGGEVVCLGRLIAKEIGTITGTATSVHILGDQGSMKASVVHPNVSLTIGNLSYKFVDSFRMVEAKIDSQGALTVTSAGRAV